MTEQRETRLNWRFAGNDGRGWGAMPWRPLTRWHRLDVKLGYDWRDTGREWRDHFILFFSSSTFAIFRWPYLPNDKGNMTT